MPRKFEKFQKSDRKREFRSNSFLDQYISELDGSQSDSQDSLNGLNLSKIIVRRALNRLSELEREVVIKYYYQGIETKEVAADLLLTSDDVSNIRIKSIEKLRNLIMEEKLNEGLTSDFNQCGFCIHSKVGDINEKIHIWMDCYSWKTRGLLKDLKKLFEFEQDVTQKDLNNHIEYHLGVEDFSILSTSFVKSEAPSLQLGITIDPKIRVIMDEIVIDFGVSRSFVIRQSLSYGLKYLKLSLEMNEMLIVEQLKLVQVMRKISI